MTSGNPTSMKRKSATIVLSDSGAEEDVPLAIRRTSKGKERASSLDHCQSRPTAPVVDRNGTPEDEYDQDFGDFGDVDFDFESLHSRPVGTSSQSKAIRPVPKPKSPQRDRNPILSPLLSHSDKQTPLTRSLDENPGLPMLSQLPDDEQEFFRSHWRRGADRAEQRQDMDDIYASETRLERDTVKKRATPVRRGGFWGRGRGRTRGRGQKR